VPVCSTSEPGPRAGPDPEQAPQLQVGSAAQQQREAPCRGARAREAPAPEPPERRRTAAVDGDEPRRGDHTRSISGKVGVPRGRAGAPWSSGLAMDAQGLSTARTPRIAATAASRRGGSSSARIGPLRTTRPSSTRTWTARGWRTTTPSLARTRSAVCASLSGQGRTVDRTRATAPRFGGSPRRTVHEECPRGGGVRPGRAAGAML